MPANRAGADAGEVLPTIAAVKPVSAARACLRAANYYAVAVNAIGGLDGTDRLLPTFREHRAAWDGFVANTRWPVERVYIVRGHAGLALLPRLLRHAPPGAGLAAYDKGDREKFDRRGRGELTRPAHGPRTDRTTVRLADEQPRSHFM
jgi:hypothetical protein